VYLNTGPLIQAWCFVSPVHGQSRLGSGYTEAAKIQTRPRAWRCTPGASTERPWQGQAFVRAVPQRKAVSRTPASAH
jgi:hypothetical protein